MKQLVDHLVDLPSLVCWCKMVTCLRYDFHVDLTISIETLLFHKVGRQVEGAGISSDAGGCSGWLPQSRPGRGVCFDQAGDQSGDDWGHRGRQRNRNRAALGLRVEDLLGEAEPIGFRIQITAMTEGGE